MDNATFNQHRTALTTLREAIMGAKGPVYTQATGDRLHNFKLVAQMTGLTPGQVLSVYLAKQTLSMLELLTNPNVKDTEKDTRFADAQNYTDLGYAMYKEGSHHESGRTVGKDDGA